MEEINPRSETALKVEELSGQNLFACYQCGECSSGCPMSEEMDLLPNQVIRYLQLGFSEVLGSKTPWVCSSCLTCSVRCPKEVDIAGIMEALRTIRLREEKNHVDLKTLRVEDDTPPLAFISALRKYVG
jgi:heterodisulfide reductase subunit C